MSNSEYGWRGIAVRNADGRTGAITSEDGFGPWLELRITCTDGAMSTVHLNARGKDSGESGWQWLCEDFSGGPAWLRLGDLGAPHSIPPTQHKGEQ